MHCDFLIIGGGIIGLSIARELKRAFPDAGIALLEKEPACGLHASGRNSGILHAGFYYTPDSLKARMTCLGNRLLTQYCERHGLPVNRCGKLVVARDESDLAMLDTLLERGRENGVELELVSRAQAREIEPRVKTCEKALFSPTTASIDPRAVMQAMEKQALAEGILIHRGVRFLRRHGNHAATTAGKYQAGYIVNAAGLHADVIARQYGFSQDCRILPFKGMYLYSSEPAGAIRTHIYPVPDMHFPFLGVHFTVTVDGGNKIGPTAIPALWREQYAGWRNFRPGELLDITWRGLDLFMHAGFDFRRLAADEFRKYRRANLVRLAARLASGIDGRNYRTWGRPGIRAQLLNTRTKTLVTDFVIEGDDKSMHILNAVSPAYTCAIPFARHVCGQIGQYIQ
jgi:L-2-hydroxyglutarate oxidase